MTREELAGAIKPLMMYSDTTAEDIADRILAAIAAEKVEPTANEGLVGLVDAVRKWDDHYCEGEVCVKSREILWEILKLYDRPAPALPVEPLAVLAKRKGSSIYGIYELAGLWRINIALVDKDGSKSFKEETYEAAELAARAFLSSLPDKLEGVI